MRRVSKFRRFKKSACKHKSTSVYQDIQDEEMTSQEYAIHAAKLQSDQVTSFRPIGNSMLPRIKSGQLVTIEPINSIKQLNKNDVVFCKCKSRYMVHLVGALQRSKNMVMITNNRKKVNGWIGIKNVFGKVTQIND